MTVQIAVKLPDGLLGELDRLVEPGPFSSRSHAVRSGLEAMVATRRRQAIDRQYREAGAVAPETREELADATRLAVDAIDDEPWGALPGGDARPPARRAGDATA